jgi:CheY-like chemotaxis protein
MCGLLFTAPRGELRKVVGSAFQGPQDAEVGPTNTRNEAVATAVEVAGWEGLGMKILVVDDDAVCRTVLVTTLRLDGHDVIEAENGRQAIGTLARRPQDIDLMITDLMMPEMDGLTLLRYVRSTPGLERVDVIVCSANPNSQVPTRPGEKGIAARLLKPIELRDLRAAVDGVATARAAMRDAAPTAAGGSGGAPKPEPSAS